MVVSVAGLERGGGGGPYTSVVVLVAAVHVAVVVEEVVVPLQLTHQVPELVHSPSSAGKKVWHCVVEPFMVRYSPSAWSSGSASDWLPYIGSSEGSSNWSSSWLTTKWLPCCWYWEWFGAVTACSIVSNARRARVG